MSSFDDTQDKPFDSAQGRQDHIRNFAIIAHIDHGKSTLADRLLEMTGTVQMRDMHAQLLDSNPIERERGITIKLAPVRMIYKMSNAIRQLAEQMINEKQKKFDIGHVAFDIANSEYILNLIDTPGHVDFGYEVSRSLAACEGAVLVVDATQGVQAQTLANLHQAQLHNLVIIPVINKIDMPNVRIEETEKEIEALGFKHEDIIKISAKTGENVEAVLEAIVARVPSPRGEPEKPLRALIFSSQYDIHKGVVVFVRVVDGKIGDSRLSLKVPQGLALQTKLLFMASGAEVAPIEVGYFMPAMVESAGIGCGEVGYIATGLKDIRFAKVGDTITSGEMPKAIRQLAEQMINKKQKALDIGHLSLEISVSPLPGYKEPKSMVFLGLFPISADDFTASREAMERLQLSDSAFTFRPISSLALGNGFHCGFLGLLHAEIVQERILREFGLTMIATAPSVEYRVKLNPGVSPAKAGLTRLSAVSPAQSATQNQAASGQLPADSLYSIQSASEYPDPSMINETREPIMQVSIFSPRRYVGAIMQLAQEKRGAYIDLKYIGDQAHLPTPEGAADGGQAEFTYLIPLSEMIVDFFDRLKSVTEGYASLDYEFYEHQIVQVDKVDILVNKEKVDALGFLIVHAAAIFRARTIVERLAAVIPRQQFEVPIQGAIGGQVIARSDVKSFRKDVIAKLYGGDRSRKDKLLDKQKKGKVKLKLIGRVEIPQTAFFEVLKSG